MPKRKKFRITITPILILIFIIGFYVGDRLHSPKVEYIEIPVSNFTPFKVNMYLPAVDERGTGILTKLEVQAMPGDGKVLTNIDKLLFWTDTQYSIQTAKYLAENYTGIDADKFDLIYMIETDNVSIVGGPSAGAALTIATIAALKGKQPKEGIILTGTVDENGMIGPVGGVLEKARAAKEGGAEVFLVPGGQSIQTFLRPEEKCIKERNFLFCETRYVKKTINIGEEIGISVMEVSDIRQAAKIFDL